MHAGAGRLTGNEDARAACGLEHRARLVRQRCGTKRRVAADPTRRDLAQELVEIVGTRDRRRHRSREAFVLHSSITIPSLATSTPVAQTSSIRSSIDGFMWVIMIFRARRLPSSWVSLLQFMWPVTARAYS